MTGKEETPPNRRLELEILAVKLEEEGWLPTVAHALLQEKLIETCHTQSIQAYKLASLVSESAAIWLITCEDLHRNFSPRFEVKRMVNQYQKLINL